jgi:hypothetical protein
LLTVYAVTSGPSTSCSVVPKRWIVGLTAEAVAAVNIVAVAIAAAPIAVLTADLVNFTLSPLDATRVFCSGGHHLP